MSKGDIFPTFTSPVLRWRRCRFGRACSTPPSAGSLNHFSDTVLALREIGRTMKTGAPLAVMCFAAGNKGLFKYRSLRERAEKHGGHIDSVAVLERYVAEAGFEDFHPHAYGSVLVFSARKRPEH